MTVALLALAAIPPFAGFFSKEAVLGAAEHAATGDARRAPAAAGWTVLVAGLLTALLTAAYAARLWLLAFRGKGAEAPDHGRQPVVMNAVLWVLVVPTARPRPRLRHPPRLVRRRRPLAPTLTTSVLGTGVALVGVLVTYAAWRHTTRPRRPHPARRRRRRTRTPTPAARRGRGHRHPRAGLRRHRRPPPTRPTPAGSCSARCTATRPPASTSTPSTRAAVRPPRARRRHASSASSTARSSTPTSAARAAPPACSAPPSAAPRPATCRPTSARCSPAPSSWPSPPSSSPRSVSLTREPTPSCSTSSRPSSSSPCSARSPPCSRPPPGLKGREPRPGRAAPRRHRHRRRPRRRRRPGRRLRPRPPGPHAGQHRHQLDPGARHPLPPRRRRHLAPAGRADRAADLPVRALLAASTCPPGGAAKAFVALLLLLEVGILGTFAVLDLMLFFVAFEIVLIPMYFLIAGWGGARTRRARADQVHPLHAARLGRHAARPPARRRRDRHLRHGGTRH